MNVVILAAGTGSRLQPFTLNKPKALVELASKPLINYQLAALGQIPKAKIHLVTGYKAESFAKYPYQQFVNSAFEQSNMVHSLMKAKSLFYQDEDLLISYGDIVYLPSIVKQLVATKGDIVVSADLGWQQLWNIRMENPFADAESFMFDKSNNVLNLGQPLENIEQAQAQYIGLIKISKHALKSVLAHYDELSEQKTKNMYMTDFIQYLINQQVEVKASLHQRQWLEVDTCEDLTTYQQLMSKGQFELLGFNPSLLSF